MARITVEDCIERVPSRFELVMLAAQRARDISAGAGLTVPRDNDKSPVVALREIAAATIDLDHLRYELIHGLRRHVALEDEEREAGERAAQELAALEMPGLGPSDETGERRAIEAEAEELGEDELEQELDEDDLELGEVDEEEAGLDEADEEEEP